MKYLVMAGDDYYPLRRAEDVRGSFETLEKARAYVKSMLDNRIKCEQRTSANWDTYFDWWCILDTDTCEVLERDH